MRIQISIPLGMITLNESQDLTFLYIHVSVSFVKNLFHIQNEEHTGVFAEIIIANVTPKIVIKFVAAIPIRTLITCGL